METEPERLKLLGTCGMFGQSFRVISARKKLFAQITLALILPTCLLVLANTMVTQLVLENTVKTNSYGKDKSYDAMSGRSYPWALTLVIKVVYFTVVIILSLLATSAIVYAVACLYTSKDVTFKKVMRAVPKLWTRLLVTFFWTYLIFFVYTLISVVVIFACAAAAVFLVAVARPVGILLGVLAVLLAIAYVIGSFYISIVLQLACVVSVLEDVYGRKAISKSRALLKGKLWSVVGCFVLLSLCFVSIEFGFVFLNNTESPLTRVVTGIVFWFLLALDNFLILVVSAVIHFVCKSYHHQGNLEMPRIRDRLEGGRVEEEE